MKILIFCALLVVSGGLIAGCNHMSADTSRYTMSPEDEALADLVLQRLQDDPIASRHRIGVDVSDGVVTLRGHNPGDEAKQRIYSIVQATNGVREVKDSFIGF